MHHSHCLQKSQRSRSAALWLLERLESMHLKQGLAL